MSENFDPAAIAQVYEAGGAAAISVLTDREFFKGSLDDLLAARAAIRIPVLRKDFTIDEFHVVEAAAYGADAILLIAALLDESELRRFRELAATYHMAALVEVHDETELDRALASGAEIVGVNNRNLHTFEVTLETSLRLAEKIPAGVVKVTESGIHSSADVKRLRAAGFHAFLVGEHLMKSPDPAAALRELAVMMIKICGITRREDAEAAVNAGASALGFIFYPKSPRYITPAAAAALGDGLATWKVGVFVDESPAAIEAVMRAANLDVAQIYGDAIPANTRVWKAFRPAQTCQPRAARKRFCSTALPTVSPSIGPSPAMTITRSSSPADSTPRMSPKLFASLTRGASTRARSSKSAPGIKDHDKVRAFVKAAQEAQ